MSAKSWANSLPYLVPNWGTVGDDDRALISRNFLEPNHQIGVGGIGVFDGLAQNEIRKCNYVTKNCTLPFWVNNTRVQDTLPFINTMCISSSRRMFAYNSKTIRSFQLDLDESRINHDEPFSFDTKISHQYSTEKSSNSSPFIWKSSSFREHKCDESILDLKIYDYRDRFHFMTYSPTLLKIYDCDQYGNLFARFSYGSNSSLFKIGNELEACDMNYDFQELLLTNFRDNNTVYTYDSHVDCVVYENKSIQSDQNDNRNRLIGVNWTENHNPFLYFFGTHRELFVGDIREHKSSKLAQSNGNLNLRNFELFQTMKQNPVEGNQVIVSTDLNIVFYDMRFPKKNIFQFRHMIDNKLVRKLHCKLVNINSSPRLMLFMSNFSTCALATMDVNTCFQPIMKHSLIHVNIPNDIGRLFPSFGTSDLLITGAQIVPGKLSSSLNTNEIFSLFLNLSNGDIWSQDFFVADEDYIHSGKDMLESSFYQNPYAQQFDEHVLQYMKNVEQFVDESLSKSATPFTNPSSNHNDQYLFEQEMQLLNLNDSPKIFPKNQTNPELKFFKEDPLDFDAMLDLWKSKPDLRKNFRQLTCKLTDHFVDSIKKIEQDNVEQNTSENVEKN